MREHIDIKNEHYTFKFRVSGVIIRDNKISKENTFQPKFVSSSVKKIKKNFSLRQYNFNIIYI